MWRLGQDHSTWNKIFNMWSRHNHHGFASYLFYMSPSSFDNSRILTTDSYIKTRSRAWMSPATLLKQWRSIENLCRQDRKWSNGELKKHDGSGRKHNSHNPNHATENKGKVKLHDILGVTLQLHVFLTSALDPRWVVSFMTRLPSYEGKGSWHPLNRQKHMIKALRFNPPSMCL